MCTVDELVMLQWNTSILLAVWAASGSNKLYPTLPFLFPRKSRVNSQLYMYLSLSIARNQMMVLVY